VQEFILGGLRRVQEVEPRKPKGVCLRHGARS